MGRTANSGQRHILSQQISKGLEHGTQWPAYSRLRIEGPPVAPPEEQSDLFAFFLRAQLRNCWASRACFTGLEGHSRDSAENSGFGLAPLSSQTRPESGRH